MEIFLLKLNNNKYILRHMLLFWLNFLNNISSDSKILDIKIVVKVLTSRKLQKGIKLVSYIYIKITNFHIILERLMVSL